MSQVTRHIGLADWMARRWVARASGARFGVDGVLGVVRAAAAVPVRGYLRAYHRLAIEGRENLPGEGRSFVMVANHCSHLDALCLLAALPWGRVNRAYPVAAEDYFCRSALRVAAAEVFVNAVPFRRGGHTRQGLGVCRRLLEGEGNVVILFPEGTRSRDGRVGAFRPGVGRLVAGTGVPVVPCGIVGTWGALPKGAVVPRPSGVRVRVGRARMFEGVGREGVREVGEVLRGEVEALVGDR